MTWRRFKALVLHLPPEAASVQATNPDAVWALNEHLLAGIYDLLAAGNWQRGGNKRSPRPKPLPRPGVKTPVKKFGTASRSIEDMRERLAKRRGGEHGCRARTGVHQPGSLSAGDRSEPRP